MIYNTLKELSMAGVCWELSEESLKQDVKQKPIQQTFKTNQSKTENVVIVPPTAPITLDTVKSMVERPDTIEALVRMVGEFNHPLRSGATNVVLPNIAEAGWALVRGSAGQTPR